MFPSLVPAVPVFDGVEPHMVLDGGPFVAGALVCAGLVCLALLVALLGAGWRRIGVPRRHSHPVPAV